MTKYTSKEDNYLFNLPLKAFLTLFILFIALPNILAEEDKNHHIKINGVYSNKSIAEILIDIEASYNVSFSYSNKLIDNEKVVSVEFDGEKIEDAIKKILGEGYAVKVYGNTIILNKRKNNSITIYGYVYDTVNKEAVHSALVYIPGKKVGTWSNAYGFYSINCEKGDLIKCKYLGYKDKTYKVKSRNTQRYNFNINPITSELEEITVSRENFSLLSNSPLGLNQISHKILKKTPALTGESDLVKSLHTLTGISSHGDGTNAFYVRGGRHDQNLILIDEAPVYNPTHMFGFFSSFSSDIVRDVKVFKGFVPAKYGGRNSSVIDIRMREGNREKMSSEIGASPYIGHLIFEGPVGNKMNLFSSYRQSLFGWLFKLQNPNQVTRFFDINLKMNYRINKKNRIFLSGYGGYDKFSSIRDKTDEFGMNWGNYTTTLRLNHLFSEHLFSNTTFIFSRYNYNLVFSEIDKLYWHSYIQDYSLKEDINWFINNNNTLNTGIGYTLHVIDPGNLLTGSNIDFTPPEISVKTSGELFFYIGNSQKIGEKLMAYYGLRLPVWLSIGGAKEFNYDENHNVSDTIVFGKEEIYNYYINPEPRMSLNYKFNNREAVKLNYSRLNQYIQMLNNTVSPFTSMDVWYPSGYNLKPLKSDIISLGYIRKFWNSGLEFVSEVYYKKIHNQIEYKDHASLMLNPSIESQLRTGESENYGIELMLYKKKNRLTGWVGYTLSRSIMKIPELNNGNPYSSRWDKPHKFNINLNYKILKGLQVSAAWIYTSGNVVTTPSSFYYHNGVLVPYYNTKNNKRLPPYHRLDFSLNYEFKIKGINFVKNHVSLSIYNLYNRANPFNVTFNKILVEEEEFVIPSDLNQTPYIVPTNIYLLGVVPSISYKLIF